jgi:hypothetical protein
MQAGGIETGVPGDFWIPSLLAATAYRKYFLQQYFLQSAIK